ncbi:hypothetical protein ACTL6U_16645 [Rhodovibrionaceae bacterium A322]
MLHGTLLSGLAPVEPSDRSFASSAKADAPLNAAPSTTLASTALAKPKQVALVPIFCFSIHALAEPGVMPRVLELFAKRNLIPQRWHSDRHGPDGQELSIDLQLHDLDSETGEYIARCLRQIFGVEQVLTSQKF